MTEAEEKALETILAQINWVMERWYKGQTLAMLKHMDAEVTYFSPFENSRVDGKDAIQSLFAPLEGQIHVPGYEIVDPKLILDENMGVVTYHLHELAEDGALMTGWKVTDVYQQAGDEWRLVHTHYTPYGANQ